MRLTEVLLMQELGLSLTEINNMISNRVHEYVIILDEIGKMKQEKMNEAQRNG